MGVLNKRIVFAGCARNCAEFLPGTLANIDRIAGLFTDASFVLIENDSTDATRTLLREWCNSHPTAHLITRDDFYTSAPRTIRLARLRSEYTALVKRKFADRDYLVVLDCDNVNASEINLDAVMRAVDFLAQDKSRAGVFANSLPVYYDMWALRHPELCPGDALEEVLDYAARFRVPADEAFTNTFAKRIFQLEVDGPSLEVDSAFGGLAIYKMSSILTNRAPFIGYKKKVLPSQKGWTEVGFQLCEHVSFNAGFRARGEKLFVLPWLINLEMPGLEFSASAYRNMVFDLNRHPHMLSWQDATMVTLRRVRAWYRTQIAAHH
jgi:hypothetical protein